MGVRMKGTYWVRWGFQISGAEGGAWRVILKGPTLGQSPGTDLAQPL